MHEIFFVTRFETLNKDLCKNMYRENIMLRGWQAFAIVTVRLSLNFIIECWGYMHLIERTKLVSRETSVTILRSN
jgi:hypothetical protein